MDEFLRRELLAARPDYGWLSEETDDDGSRQKAKRKSRPPVHAALLISLQKILPPEAVLTPADGRITRPPVPWQSAPEGA